MLTPVPGVFLQSWRVPDTGEPWHKVSVALITLALLMVPGVLANALLPNAMPSANTGVVRSVL